MAAINKLSAKQVVTLPKGLHGDGGNLYLSVRNGGSRQWVMRYRVEKRQRELGLGGAGRGGMTLAEARTKAEEVRTQLRKGEDPLAAKEKAAKVKVVPTFREEMESHISRTAPSWKNEKSGPQWRASLETHAAILMDLPVDVIEVSHITSVLDPIWHKVPETAKRVRGRVETILSMSKTKGNRSGDNPAAWRDNLKNIFPSTPKLVNGHFASMSYEEAPAFIRDLRAKDSLSSLALEWQILTILRPTVAVNARWEEIDLKRRLWTIKAAKMKGDLEAAVSNEDHVVPLQDDAVAILRKVEGFRVTGKRSELVFPNDDMKPLSLTALDHCRERMGIFTTTHGFRSTFRTWAAEETFHEDSIAEKAMAHLVGDEVQRAYNRGPLLQKRRVLMKDWADYLAGRLTLEENPFVRQGSAIPAIVIDEMMRRKNA